MTPITHLAELADRIKPGARVVVHSACAAPPRLCAQLVELAASRGPFRVFDLTTLGVPPFMAGLAEGALRLTTFVPGAAVRRFVDGKGVKVIRRPLSRAPEFVTGGGFRPDVLLLQLSPPDAQGRLSLGISVDVIRAALASARLVIAEINPRMPRTCGDTAVLPDQIDHVLEVDAPLATVALGAGDPAGDAIADNIAGLIRDGDVIQTGIGAIPDLMALRLGHCRNLGLHTGIITEAVRPLIDGGVITNPQGAFPGRSVATLAAGSASFYDFLHGNTAVAFHPCSLTHDRRLLAGIPQFCAVNGALEIDLAGRVNAERVDGRPVSAPGGQPDFAFGGARAAGGKSIVALRATSKDGTVSRIVPALAPGVAATITARDITHVATEHGVARIAGLSGSALRDALVGIAAPAFRAALRQAPG